MQNESEMSPSEIWNAITDLLEGDASDRACGMDSTSRNEYIIRVQRGETIEDIAAEITAETADLLADIDED